MGEGCVTFRFKNSDRSTRLSAYKAVEKTAVPEHPKCRRPKYFQARPLSFLCHCCRWLHCLILMRFIDPSYRDNNRVYSWLSETVSFSHDDKQGCSMTSGRTSALSLVGKSSPVHMWCCAASACARPPFRCLSKSHICMSLVAWWPRYMSNPRSD